MPCMLMTWKWKITRGEAVAFAGAVASSGRGRGAAKDVPSKVDAAGCGLLIGRSSVGRSRQNVCSVGGTRLYSPCL
jgi:hypothetical protein